MLEEITLRSSALQYPYSIGLNTINAWLCGVHFVCFPNSLLLCNRISTNAKNCPSPMNPSVPTLNIQTSKSTYSTIMSLFIQELPHLNHWIVLLQHTGKQCHSCWCSICLIPIHYLVCLVTEYSFVCFSKHYCGQRVLYTGFLSHEWPQAVTSREHYHDYSLMEQTRQWT